MERLWELDQSVFRAIHHGWNHKLLDRVFWAISTSGLGHVQALLLLVLMWALWKRRPGDRTPLALFVAFTLSGILNTAILKDVFPRHRPSLLADSLPQEHMFHDSFPSGHTATSFGIAAILLLLPVRTPRAWLGWAAMLWAALVGISRIYRGVHWPSDVVGGAMVGIAAACITFLVFDPLFQRILRTPGPEPSSAGANEGSKSKAEAALSGDG